MLTRDETEFGLGLESDRPPAPAAPPEGEHTPHPEPQTPRPSQLSPPVRQSSVQLRLSSSSDSAPTADCARSSECLIV